MKTLTATSTATATLTPRQGSCAPLELTNRTEWMNVQTNQRGNETNERFVTSSVLTVSWLITHYIICDLKCESAWGVLVMPQRVMSTPTAFNTLPIPTPLLATPCQANLWLYQDWRFEAKLTLCWCLLVTWSVPGTIQALHSLYIHIPHSDSPFRLPTNIIAYT